jgi:hypothetical protein
MDKTRRALGCLHEIRLDSVIQDRRHHAIRLDVAAAYGRALARARQNDLAEP